jgi:hypothetical protein
MPINNNFTIPETGEVVLVKPDGRMEFRNSAGFESCNSITFSSESAAVQYAKARGWKEVPAQI